MHGPHCMHNICASYDAPMHGSLEMAVSCPVLLSLLLQQPCHLQKCCSSSTHVEGHRTKAGFETAKL